MKPKENAGLGPAEVDIIAGLRKELNKRELEILGLKNERAKAELAAENTRRELDTFISAMKDAHLCHSCSELLRPLVTPAHANQA